MKSDAEIIIAPQELRSCKILNKTIVLQKIENILIEGRVLDRKLNPVEGAVIVIKSIDCNYDPPKINEFGYVITNEYGAYAISLKKIYNVNYELYIYEPMIKA
ncbi:hypothetical protein [Clostridium sp.]|uniref:hypothetical protein n=1 Tax=Clostridium sp. TaxID=1506 RepID=UPI00283B7D8A|nr:hypothetical protein [Clostridium sp.]MDR3594086.1 hypothetical protein [Clostridium sp.]